ncbi:MAG: choice-of-anchor A family protein [Flavobacteriales bacterium]|nr:choice-of-anchor A family protein [Flavobacteriales bacterium]
MKKTFSFRFSSHDILVGVLFVFIGVVGLSKTPPAFAQNPTAPALGFNVFLENYMRVYNGETEGPAAMGGNLKIDGNFQFAVNNPGSFQVSGVTVPLVINGKVEYISGNTVYVNQNGYIKIGNCTGSVVWYTDPNNAFSPIRITPTTNYNSTPRIQLQANAQMLNVSASNNPVCQGGLIDFTAAFNTMKNTSLSISLCQHNAQLTNANGVPIPNTNLPSQVKINLQPGINYLNISGTDLNNVQVFTYVNQPDPSRILIINVDAPGTFHWNVWNQAGIGNSSAPYVLYNFYNTTHLHVNGSSGIWGTLFAPFCYVDKYFNSNNIVGQVIAKEFCTFSGEVHYYPFNANVPGCATNPAQQGNPPVADFSVKDPVLCYDKHVFYFTNLTFMSGCPSPYIFEEYNDAASATAQFNQLLFSAEGRSGNNALNGTFELDIHKVSNYFIHSSAQFVWPNNVDVPFSIVYDPNAAGDNKFVFTVGTGSSQKILKLDPQLAGYITPVNGFWFYSRTAPNTTLMVSNLVIDGVPAGTDFGYVNPSAASFKNVVFRGTALQDGFTITGNVKFAWTGTIPQNSNLNWNFKLGNLNCDSYNYPQAPDSTVTYLWDFGDGNTSTDVNPTHTYANPGTYTVKLTACNMHGCTTDSLQVTVLPYPNNYIYIADTLSAGSGSFELEFGIGNQQPGEQYEWTFPDGSTSTSVNPTFEFDSAGTYLISLVTTDTNGCPGFAEIYVCVSDTDITSGNDGGIESYSLGDLVSKRYLFRKMASRPTKFQVTEDLLFNKYAFPAVRSGFQTLEDLFPTELAPGGTSYISSPTDLLDFTIAVDVLSVDYQLDGVTKASVLGTLTAGQPYNHTKVTCDRLRGAEITAVWPVTIQGKKFIQSALRQRDGRTEYAISFTLGRNLNSNEYSLQSNWIIHEYVPADTMYNFMVWTTSPTYTIKMVNDILNNAQAFLSVQQTEVQKVPSTYVRKIDRKEGVLKLHIFTNNPGRSANISGEIKNSETSNYTGFNQAFNTGEHSVVDIPLGDAYELNGVLHVLGIPEDVFYHADGNWGLHYDPQYTFVNQYVISNDPNRPYNPFEYSVLRNLQLSAGTNFDFITVYKAIGPGNIDQDLTPYSHLQFYAKGVGVLELVLVKTSVQNWTEQYKMNFQLDPQGKYHLIPLTAFASSGTSAPIVPNDVAQVVWNFVPGSSNQTLLNMEIQDVRFLNANAPNVSIQPQAVLTENEFVVYPNPTEGPLTVAFVSASAGQGLLKITDVHGRVVHQENIQIFSGLNELNRHFNAQRFSRQVLLLSVEMGGQTIGRSKVNFR